MLRTACSVTSRWEQRRFWGARFLSGSRGALQEQREDFGEGEMARICPLSSVSGISM